MNRLNNSTQRETLATDLVIPRSLWRRMKGLLGRSGMAPGEGLMLRSSRWVHTLGMRFAIDLLFVDRNFRVVGCRKNVRPGRVALFCLAAKHTIELPAGTVERSGTRPGDCLEIIA